MLHFVWLGIDNILTKAHKLINPLKPNSWKCHFATQA